MSAAMLSLNKLMRKVFVRPLHRSSSLSLPAPAGRAADQPEVLHRAQEEELKARETAASLGVHRREGVPMTHRMRLLYHGERY